MSEFEQMLAESFKTIKTGEVVKGKVIAVHDDEVVVNIGYKHDALLAKSELTADPSADLHELIHEGDEIEAKIAKVNDGEGNVLLTKKRMFAERTSQVLQDAFDNQTVLKAVVDEVVEKGLSVTVDDVKVFIPASLVSEPFEKDLSKYMGQEIEFVVQDYIPKKRRVIGNRKVLLQKAREEALQAILENLHEGDIVEGTVKSVTDFGAFIDLGGADGLLHITEFGWGRVGNAKKVLKPGDCVRAFVKSINGKKIGLSRKFPDENPWANAEEKFAVGTVITGKVARLTDFGAFVNLAEGIDGLVHVSQIQRERVEKPSDVLELGQEVTAKIIGMDPEQKKISLSMRALLPKQDRPEKKSHGFRQPKEENLENEDGTVNLAKYIEKLDREAAAEEAKKTAEQAKNIGEEAAGKAAEVKEAVSEKAEELVEKTEEKVEEAVGAAEAKAEEVTETVETKAEEAADAIEAKAEEAVAEVQEAVQEAVETKPETEA